MSKYKIISLSAAVGIIVAGCVYLFAGASAAGVVLAVIAVLIAVMAAANALQTKSEGAKNFVMYIPSICLAIVAIAAGVATVVWFLK